MNIEQAKARLAQFLGEDELTFSIKKYPDGEWVAECNEIPAIMTGGMASDITNMDAMIRDAIVTAAGVETEYAGQILRFTGYRQPKQSIASNLFSPSKEAEKSEADYVIA
jgi:hypothetical protein